MCLTSTARSASIEHPIAYMYTHLLLNPATNMAAAIGRFAKASFAAAKKARIGDIMGVSKVSAVC